GNPLILARQPCSTSQKDEQHWKLRDSRYLEILGISGVIYWDCQWLRDPSNFQTQCISSVEFISEKWRKSVMSLGTSFTLSFKFVMNSRIILWT
ncbi:Os06g0559500, partial [Oryza sativa Japonica Group]